MDTMPMTAREIKSALVLKDVTQAEIGRRCGYSRGHVGDVIEGNRRNAKIESAIANAIGKPVGEVFPVEKPAAALAS